MTLTTTSTAEPSATSAEPAAAAATAGRGVLPATLVLRHAGARTLRLAYEWQGPADAPVVFVAGGISAHRHLAACAAFPEPGWWPQQVGAGQALDPSRFRLLAFDWIGADGTLDAPIDSADQADAIAALLAHLGIERLACFVGCSYGAMVGLQFAARHPEAIGQLVAISGADSAHPYSSAWRALQRRIARLGASEGGRREALSLARQLAMLSYRTPEEFAERFDAPVTWDEGVARFGADAYLEACGASYVARTAPTAFLRLSESIDLHRVSPEAVRAPTTLVAVEEDRLVPRHSLVDLAERLPALRRLRLLRSPYGHDAFLKEDAEIGAVLRDALGASFAGAQA